LKLIRYESGTYVRQLSNLGGFNIRWLMRAIMAQAAKAAKAFFFGLLWLVNLLLGGKQVGIQRALGAENRATPAWRVGGRPDHTPAVYVVG
jgi:hypothetical protein